MTTLIGSSKHFFFMPLACFFSSGKGSCWSTAAIVAAGHRALNGHSQAGNWQRQKRWSELPFSHPVPKTLGAVSVSLWNPWLGWPALLSRRNFTVGPTQPMAASGRYASSQRRDVDALIERVVRPHLQPGALQFLCEGLAHAQSLGARGCR